MNKEMREIKKAARLEFSYVAMFIIACFILGSLLGWAFKTNLESISVVITKAINMLKNG